MSLASFPVLGAPGRCAEPSLGPVLLPVRDVLDVCKHVINGKYVFNCSWLRFACMCCAEDASGTSESTQPDGWRCAGRRRVTASPEPPAGGRAGGHGPARGRLPGPRAAGR